MNINCHTVLLRGDVQLYSKISNINNYIHGFLEEDFKDRISSPNDPIYTIELKYQFRPDLLAQKFYGNASLYWVLVIANSIPDSPEGFITGRRIRVPPYERVVSVI